MKIVYSDTANPNYWDSRWEAAGPDQSRFQSTEFYPIKYAEMVTDKANRILEAGCGNGRLYFHYPNKGKDIVGIDNSGPAIQNIKGVDPEANVQEESITNLSFEDGICNAVLCFGLFHNLIDPEQLGRAFKEVSRILKPGGKVVASVRADNVENDVSEWIIRKRRKGHVFDQFHKLQFQPEDLRYFLESTGFVVERIMYVRNVSFLFKFNWLRRKDMKEQQFVENEARSLGFKLNPIGQVLDRLLHGIFPRHFSNLLVAIAQKK